MRAIFGVLGLLVVVAIVGVLAKKQLGAGKRTDDEYWRILEFEFLEGGPFGTADVTEARFVAVINRGVDTIPPRGRLNDRFSKSTLSSSR